MLEYFDAYARTDPDMALVLMGVKMMKLPEAPYLRLAGVLPARDRMSACEAALVTIAPAAGDLVAEPVLESLAVGTPVLVSQMNAAAAEHCRASNGGLYYANGDEFVAALRRLTGDARLRDALGEHGRQYVQQHHRWEAVLGRFERLLGRVKGR
jgi:glycosyltransferase involved in cell wall biosynthesis